MEKIAIFWFRRDLRLEDNTGLYHALKSGLKVLPIFIFDINILGKLENKSDPRVQFIHQQIVNISYKLREIKSDLSVYYDTPANAFKQLFSNYNIENVYANHDYEAYSLNRDSEIKNYIATKGSNFYTFKDQCIFEQNEILSNSGTPYTIFTPYSRKWKEKLNENYLTNYDTEKYLERFINTETKSIPTLSEIGFKQTDYNFPETEISELIVAKYEYQRNFPAILGTTHIGIHLRFGTISIRKCVKLALKLSESWLNELIWRDFYMNILAHFPQINEGKSFKPAYDRIIWRNNLAEFEHWCNGQTGYPIVDAGMRELNTTGFMHNRIRMITASFLVKHLLIDWRWGEAYFAEKLLDFDFAANNGGWQWSAGSGCDAAPYFRIFNPRLQTLKFDQEFNYIRKWVPEFNSLDYPQPIVNHDFARKRVLEAYRKALGA